MKGEAWCYVHHPDYHEQRRRAVSKGGKRGGRGRPMAELADFKAQLSDLYSGVITGMTQPKTGAVLAQITNTQLRIAEVELKVRAQLELEERLEALEEQLEVSGGGHRAG